MSNAPIQPHANDPSVLREYREVKPVGSGSFGTVLLVADKDDRQYVMKVIDISRMKPKERKDATQEAKLLATLKHPYIVSYRDSWVENGILCIVMDYAENGDLCRAIQRQRKAGRHFSEQQIVRWFTQALLAIKHLHDRHILHRDIKSSNFFLTASGRLRAGDFGIAKVLENTAAVARTTIGTPYYLSPEICREEPYSWSSDMWALGVVLHEMCALKVPFDAPHIHALVEKITREAPPPIPAHYSPELRQLVLDLLDKDHTRRPSAAHVLQLPVIQAEIRAMLKEEQEKKARLKAAQQTSAPPTSTPQPAPIASAASPSPLRGDTGVDDEEEDSPTDGPQVKSAVAALKSGHVEGAAVQGQIQGGVNEELRSTNVAIQGNPLEGDGLYAKANRNAN